MNKSILIITGVVVLILGGSLIATIIMANTPQQPYTAIKKLGNIEIRYYPTAWLATVTSAESSYKKSSSNNFRKLASYIFGGNQADKKIAMTAPVRMNFEAAESAMSFVMPEGYTMDNLPVPLSDEIQLHASEAEYVAVLRFGGYASDTKIAEKKKQLFTELDSLGINHNNTVRYLGYNAPWDFLFRRNEVVASISMEDALIE